MKHLVLALVFIAGMSACKTSQLDANIGFDKKMLSGRWEWQSSTGGFAGNTITPEKEGYTQSLRFSDNKVALYKNDSLKWETGYSITRGSSIYSQEKANLIKYDNGYLPKVILKVSQDSLVLADNVYDGYSSLYLRK